jgi:hypothetical protein
MSDGAEAPHVVSSDGAGTGVVVVDLGRHKRKAIKKLRQGTGKLMDEVRETVAELRGNGTISSNADPVVLIVRERRAKPKLWF